MNIPERKDYTLVDKSEIMTCWKCEGKGHWMVKGVGYKKQTCDLCNGSGTFRESHYIIIDEKNKIAIDSDTGG